MSRIYDALKRAAKQARQQKAPAEPAVEDKGLEVLESLHRAAGPAASSPQAPGSTAIEPEAVPPRAAKEAIRPPGPPSPPPSRGTTEFFAPLAPESKWEHLKEQVADQVRVEAWIRLEAAALHELGVGRFPRSQGISGWLLEALGGVAVGFFVGTLSLLVIFVVLVVFLHIRLPQLFW